MVLATSRPDNWAFLGTNTAAEQTEEPCVEPNFTGRKTGWLRKMKNDSAKGKWLTDNNWRFFTADFHSQTIFYSNSESKTKTSSAPMAFSDIVDVKLLDRNMKRGLTERLFQNADEASVGLCLITTDREMRLLSKSMDDAKQWVSIFTAARKTVQRQREKETVVQGTAAPAETESTESTMLGSDESPPQMSDTDSDGSTGRRRPWEKNAPAESSSSPAYIKPTPEPGSKPEVFFEPDGADAFAALDALMDDIYVPEPDAPKVDVATAIKAAKAKKAQKEEGQASASASASQGYAQVQQQAVAKQVAPKKMTEEDRSANDLALLKRQQMFPKSRQPKAHDAPGTGPLRTSGASSSSGSNSVELSPSTFSTVPEPSEGVVDQGSWDHDVVPKKSKKKNKGMQKQEADEEDPTAGLDDLVNGVLKEKPVSLRVHEYVDGFHCMQCDLKVIRFTSFEWTPEADYLFFRNYYGKPKKLPRRLQDSDGVSAYCCQCAFKSVPSDTELRDVAEGTRWKCTSD